MKKSIVVALLMLSFVVSEAALAATTAGSSLLDGLEMGAEGEKVVMLQDFLRAEGHFTLPSTGYFGPLTSAALMTYQTKNGLPASGMIDDATISMMQTEADSAEIVVEAAMDRHPGKVPQVLEAVKNILKSLDPDEEESFQVVKQLSWALSAFANLGK